MRQGDGAGGVPRGARRGAAAADLLWMRETSGGVFDTPERRAELEKTLRELTARIRDESVRYHYSQEMREPRAGLVRRAARRGPREAPGERDRAGGQGGQWARGWRGARAASPSRKAWPARRWSSAPAA